MFSLLLSEYGSTKDPSEAGVAEDYEALKRWRSMRNFFILDSRVCRGMPSLAAAPVGPETSPRASRRAFSIMSLSCSTRFANMGIAGTADLGDTGRNHGSSTTKVHPSDRDTSRPITVLKSRH